MNDLNQFKNPKAEMVAKVEQMRKHKDKFKDAVSGLEQAEIATDVANKGFEVIKMMFDADPVNAMTSLVQTYKDSFKKGLFVGFVVGNLFMLMAIAIAKIW